MAIIENAASYLAQGLAPIFSTAALTTRSKHLLQARSLEKRLDICSQGTYSYTYCPSGSHCTSDYTCASDYYWTGGVAGGVVLLCIILICIRRRRAARAAMMSTPVVVTTVVPGREGTQAAPQPVQPQFASYPPPQGQPYDAYNQQAYGLPKDPAQPYGQPSPQPQQMGYAPNASYAPPSYPTPAMTNAYPAPAQTPAMPPASPYGQPQVPYSTPYGGEATTYVPAPQK